jgi:hypothetical protein
VSAHHDAEAHAAQPEDRHAHPGLHPRGVHHRPHPGHHRASEQGRLLQGDLRIDSDQGFLGGHGETGEGGDAQMMVEGLPRGVPEAPRSAEQRSGRVRPVAVLAQDGAADGAVEAPAAHGDEGEDHVVPRPQLMDARADLPHDPGSLVAQDHRHGPRPGAIDHREVRMAQAGGRHLHQHLPGPRPLQLHLLHGKRPGFAIGRRPPHLVKDRCQRFHPSPPDHGAGRMTTMWTWVISSMA